MNKETKPLLSSAQQIEHLKSKGVQFNIISEADAEKYLLEHNNYFKLRAYRKNFDKYIKGEKAGQYIGLDFSMLRDLAVIDMRLRYTVIQLALDVEHFIKVKLLRITERQGEDGYQIISDYFEHLKANDAKSSTSHSFEYLMEELQRNADNPYCGGIIQKCQDGYAIWAFIEVVPLGTLIHFYKFCADRFKDKDMQNDYYLLLTIRELRNAAAHNNCILNDMGASDKRHDPDKGMIQKLSTIRAETRNKRLSNERMRQLCTLFYAHAKIVTSAGVRDHTKKMLGEFKERMFQNYSYYKGNTTITSCFSFLKKAIDSCFEK